MSSKFTQLVCLLLNCLTVFFFWNIMVEKRKWICSISNSFQLVYYLFIVHIPAMTA
ncbi:hypothetical protein BCV72DRAFT_218723 [Rhizopus microsporus var. microsporus]|uniref:Uncharacterized protein n=2 Tax=Rhizopus microsporus TaxID=58291 RepID=A0A2G4SZV0_RHIZD|nr:uncharacterized protein RHIMIDRAFT_278791 [Rhizopus microsporus ATCC 52813]ORE11997.1 hypothetical protein BCV72DRAFT_218723 [Rhizopus microsporus var. microsporus]PHZ14305.1 hypothetical protein RHIMIDRAFT_278791 [Rhizopus microsporus ATCC 52813]